MADVDKTEKATPRRRRKAREEGSVARSMELNSAVLLLTGTVGVFLFGAGIATSLGNLCRSLFKAAGEVSLIPSVLPLYLWKGSTLLLALFLPFFAVLVAAGLFSNLAQIGFLITTKPLMPRLSRLSPMKGLQRLFSVRSIVELAKSILKLVVVGFVVYLSIRSEFGRILELSSLHPSLLLGEIGRLTGLVLLKASIVIFLIAMLDYAYTKHEYEKSLKMSKQEVKEEFRQTEGDPQVKSKIRGLQFRAALRRMMKKVPQADVVITNPVHIAVALKYDGKKDRAPIVIAKGARRVAERIKELARQHDIPIVENPPLAQMLYKLVDIGQEIPVELYRAVAEILAFVYRLKKKFFGLA